MEWLDSVSLSLPNILHTLFVDNDLFYLFFFLFSKLLEEAVNKYLDYNRNLAVKYRLLLVSSRGSNFHREY